MKSIRKIIAALFIVFFYAACFGSELCESGDCETRVSVAKALAFAGESEDQTTSIGFDLDNRSSIGDDRESCFQPDYVGPNGEEGIDNQFAVLWAAIIDIVGDAVEGLLKGSINDGNLLMMVEVSGIDSYASDDCVNVKIFMGKGVPYIGTDGFITSGQTFEVDHEGPMTQIECATMKDRVVTTTLFDGILPVAILDTAFDLRIHNALLQATFREDGETIDVMIGGGAEVEQIIEVAEDADYRLEGIVSTIVRNRADLDQDEYGDCQHLSATILVDSVSAHIFQGQ